jgi:hypothetical protein
MNDLQIKCKESLKKDLPEVEFRISGDSLLFNVKQIDDRILDAIISVQGMYSSTVTRRSGRNLLITLYFKK